MVAQLKSQGILAARQYRPMYHHPPYQALGDRDFEHQILVGHSVYVPSASVLRKGPTDRDGGAEAQLPFRLAVIRLTAKV